MRIAQVAPLFESVPPKLYGGTERVVSYLTEELVRQGHDVTLFASGDSVTQARLIAPCPRALRLDPACVDQLAYHIVMLEEVFRNVDRFDIIHFHIDYLHYPLSRRHREAHLSTLHGRLDLPELPPLYREFPEMPLVSISNTQRKPLPWLNWQGTVHHGLPRNLHTFRAQPGDYLAFLGRVSPEKGLEQAIETAQRVGMRLKIAAKVDKGDWWFFKERIKPLLEHPLVEWVGEVGGAAKDEFLGRAYAVLFLIDWPEPFGLVMIESMACGTPVIASPRGSVPEVMQDGVSGFVVEGVDEAVAAVQRVPSLSRRACRDYFEQRFTADRMARDYVAIYERIVRARRLARPSVDGRANGKGRAPAAREIPSPKSQIPNKFQAPLTKS